jgi:hypothetical protein
MMFAVQNRGFELVGVEQALEYSLTFNLRRFFASSHSKSKGVVQQTILAASCEFGLQFGLQFGEIGSSLVDDDHPSMMAGGISSAPAILEKRLTQSWPLRLKARGALPVWIEPGSRQT